MSNQDVEKALTDLPEEVARLKEKWRLATLERERLEAILYLKFKAEEGKQTSDEIKSRVRADEERYQSMLREITAEALYDQKYETLMSAKKLCSLRVAY